MKVINECDCYMTEVYFNDHIFLVDLQIVLGSPFHTYMEKCSDNYVMGHYIRYIF